MSLDEKILLLSLYGFALVLYSSLRTEGEILTATFYYLLSIICNLTLACGARMCIIVRQHYQLLRDIARIGGYQITDVMTVVVQKIVNPRYQTCYLSGWL